MKHYFLITFLLNLVVNFSSASLGYVPVVLWTNIRSDQCMSTPKFPVMPAENILKLSESEYFRCLQKANPKVIKLFVVEELDQSDFDLSHYQKSDTKAFAHLQSILQSTSSVVLPAVQPSSIPTFLGATLKKSFENADFSTIELPAIERASLNGKQKSVSVLDEVINQEMMNLPPDVEYIAILTAYSAPQRSPRSIDNIHFGRQLLTTEETSVGGNETKFMKYEDCIYIVYNNLTLMYQTNVWNLADGNVTSGACNENVSSIEINFMAMNSSGQGKRSVTLSFSFVSLKYPVSHDTWWNITSATVKHNFNGTNSVYELYIVDPYLYAAPANWSWVCALPDPMSWTGGTKDSPIVQKLQFSYLQMQPFDIKNSSFSRALDCSGFLTAPIWMGTVISILLLAIFAFGLSALSSITTMDRFDDPRGKTIQVHTHDN